MRHDRRRPPLAAQLAMGGLLLVGSMVSAQGVDLERAVPRLETEIERVLIEGRIPSCTIALVNRDATLWSGAYGTSNLWARTPATTDTVYLIGSIFKTMSTAAVLQLVESGRLELDAPLDGYLGELEIRGENPEHPVTLRHLLTHTSGLPAAFGGHEVWGDSVPAPLEETLRTSLAVSVPPETDVVYSNLAYTLLAYVVERVSGVPFRDYMREQVLDPLGMTSTVFRPTPEIAERLAVPYVVDPESRRPVATARLKADVWPAGIVYGTVADLARWLRAVLRGGELDGVRVLREESVVASLERQYDQFAGPMHAGWGNDTAGYGLTWWTARKDGDRHFAHSGSVPGYTAFVEGDYDAGVGVVILSNGHAAHAHLIRLADMALRLLRQAPR